MVVGVTGASGFVGSALVRTLAETGCSVVAFARKPTGEGIPNVSHRAYELAEVPALATLSGVDVVVHSAFARFDARHRNAFEVNVNGTLALFEVARSVGTRFVFISSLSAVPHARSSYGRHKLALERRLLDEGADVVRPGLVVGDGGVLRVMYETMRRFHVTVLVDGGQQPVQVIGRRDLALAVRALVAQPRAGAPTTIAGASPITARRLALDVRRRFRLVAPVVSLPFSLTYPLVAGAEAVGIQAPLSAENLLGLQASVVQPVSDIEQTLGVRMRTWDELVAELAFAGK